MNEPFHIGIVSSRSSEAVTMLGPVLAEIFDPLPYVTYDYLEPAGDTASPAELAPYDAVISLQPHFNAGSFSSGEDRLVTIARWGVGYDMIDVPACTEANVLVSITIDGVRKPVAEGIVAFFLALAKKLPAKDRLVRTGRWDLRAETSGLGLSGKTVGSVGMGNIGGEMFRLLQPFDLGRKLVYDPYLDPAKAAQAGVELVDLTTLFRESDFIAINCPLTEETRGIINADLFGLMKPTAYLVNTARGPIVNQADLAAALQAGHLAGAGLDVFEQEPQPVDHPLLQMDNVIFSPHAIAFTDDLYRGLGEESCQNVLSILRGEAPRYTVNKAVIDRPGFQAKLAALRERWQNLTREKVK